MKLLNVDDLENVFFREHLTGLYFNNFFSRLVLQACVKQQNMDSYYLITIIFMIQMLCLKLLENLGSLVYRHKHTKGQLIQGL